MTDATMHMMESPLFSALQSSVKLFSDFDRLPSVDALNKMLAPKNVNFVAQGGKPNNFAEHYEPRIFLKREVQTREQSWHDFFNALVWHRFPHTKNAINEIHYQLQKNRFPSMVRAPAENMLTIFDEHGAILVSKNAFLLELVKERRWHDLFWLHREQVREELKVIIFGHGLYEKALKPYVGLTTHCLSFHTHSDVNVDEIAADFLRQKNYDLRTSDLCPLPILGMPGLWPGNEDEAFYDNENYFRKLSTKKNAEH